MDARAHPAASRVFERPGPIQQQQFKEFLKQKDKTILRAGQDGVVAYANDSWYDSSRQIREGRDRLLASEDLHACPT